MEVNSLEELKQHFKNNKLIVIDFNAEWCGPCKRIKPVFHSFIKKYKNILFLSVDVDEASEIAEMFQIRAMPTFIFVKSQKIVHQIQGAKVDELMDAVKKLSLY